MKFLLDTNFLMIPGKFKVDIFSELQKFGRTQLFTLDLIVSELETIAKGSGKDASCAGLALGLIEKKNIEVLRSDGEIADEEIIKTALEKNFVVCSQDKGLLDRIKQNNLNAVTLKQKKYLAKA